jgi:hypothetical protein
MTCRGSRRNTADKAKNIYEDSPEWLAQNQRSSRNFIRKWGHFVKHDALMKPIIYPKYDIGIKVTGCNSELLELLEPWCSTLYVDCNYDNYIKKEQPNTKFDLQERIKPYHNEKQNNVLVEFDGLRFDNNQFNLIQQLSDIIKESGEIGSFELGNLKITINLMDEYQNTLIKI